MKIKSIKIIINNKYFIIKFSDSMDYIYLFIYLFFFNLIHYIVILIYINLLNL